MNNDNNPNCKDGVCFIGGTAENLAIAENAENTVNAENAASQTNGASEASGAGKANQEPMMVCKDGVCSIEAPAISSAPAVLDLSDFGIDAAEVDSNGSVDSPNSKDSTDSPNCEGGVCSI